MQLARGIVVGIGGTAAMDAWAIFLWAACGQGRPDFGPMGRWFWHLHRGTVFHPDIGEAAAFRRETALGWLGHYAVGVVYGVVLVALTGRRWLEAPTFLPACVLGIVTVGAGWFLLQPGMGAGWAASRLPHPWRVRGMNLLAHTVFAAGMFGTALALR